MLNSIPEIARGYSANILTGIDSIKAFQNANALAKHYGIVLNG